MKLNVRCCCSPTKVFGTLHVPGPVSPGQAIRIPMLDGSTELVLIREIYTVRYPIFLDESQEVKPVGQATELAIYSEERPIQFWLGAVGFTKGDWSGQGLDVPR